MRSNHLILLKPSSVHCPLGTWTSSAAKNNAVGTKKMIRRTKVERSAARCCRCFANDQLTLPFWHAWLTAAACSVVLVLLHRSSEMAVSIKRRKMLLFAPSFLHIRSTKKHSLCYLQLRSPDTMFPQAKSTKLTLRSVSTVNYTLPLWNSTFVYLQTWMFFAELCHWLCVTSCHSNFMVACSTSTSTAVFWPESKSKLEPNALDCSKQIRSSAFLNRSWGTGGRQSATEISWIKQMLLQEPNPQ